MLLFHGIALTKIIYQRMDGQQIIQIDKLNTQKLFRTVGGFGRFRPVTQKQTTKLTTPTTFKYEKFWFIFDEYHIQYVWQVKLKFELNREVSGSEM